MSVLIQPDKIKLNSGLLTIAAGVAVCRVFKNLCCDRPLIKWVNDIFVGGKKVCGILAEGLTNPSQGINNIIVGIGINVTTAVTDFPDELSNIAGSLFPEDATRNEIVAKILTEFKKLYADNDSGELIEEYKSLSLVINKEISFVINGKPHTGTATDINMDGNLVVTLKNGETITLKSGEVSLGSRNFINQ